MNNNTRQTLLRKSSTLQIHDNEELVWKTRRAHIVLLRDYLFCTIGLAGSIVLAVARIGVAPWLAFCPFIFVLLALYYYLDIITTVFIITNERIMIRTGVFTRSTISVELYRIKEVELVEPFLYRLFNLGNIQIVTFRRSRQLWLRGINAPNDTLEGLRSLIEINKMKRGIREVVHV